MKRGISSTWVMIALFAVVLAWYLIYEKQIRPANEKAERDSELIVKLDPSQLQEIVLERSKDAVKDGIEKIRFVKTGGDWNLAEPVQDTADRIAVSAMLTEIQNTKKERVVEEKASDLANYGLDKPALKLTLKKDSSTVVTGFSLGKEGAVGSSVFLRMEGSDSVLKVPSTLKTSLAKDLKDFRNKSLVSLGRSEVNEIEVTGPKGNFVLKLDAGKKWVVASEGGVPANETEANKLLNVLADLKAKEFASETDKNLAMYGLNSPLIKVTLSTGGEKPTRAGLSFGKVKEKVFAKRDDKPVVFELDAETYKKLDHTGDDFRSTELATFSRFDVKRIKLEAGKTVLELLKEESGWTLPTEPQTVIDNTKVDAWLTRLQDVKVARFSHDKPASLGLDKPELTVRIFERGAGGEETEKVTLKFARARAGQTPASRSGLDLPFFIKADDLKKIQLTKTELLKVEEKKTEDSKFPLEKKS